MLGLYAPTAVMLIGVSNIELPWLTIIYAVLLFIAAPLALAASARYLITKYVSAY
jgi:ACR3 family arsenite efflux pump ArsB